MNITREYAKVFVIKQHVECEYSPSFSLESPQDETEDLHFS
jgi:hypothetical protein